MTNQKKGKKNENPKIFFFIPLHRSKGKKKKKNENSHFLSVSPSFPRSSSASRLQFSLPSRLSSPPRPESRRVTLSPSSWAPARETQHRTTRLSLHRAPPFSHQPSETQPPALRNPATSPAKPSHKPSETQPQARLLLPRSSSLSAHSPASLSVRVIFSSCRTPTTDTAQPPAKSRWGWSWIWGFRFQNCFKV